MCEGRACSAYQSAQVMAVACYESTMSSVTPSDPIPPIPGGGRISIGSERCETAKVLITRLPVIVLSAKGRGLGQALAQFAVHGQLGQCAA